MEKRTASDVSHSRIWCVSESKRSLSAMLMWTIRNVQVTLQILKALIEKIPRDLPLYARYILRILILVLRSKDITMIEESLLVFGKFCQYHDGATLAADQEHIRQYEEIIQLYAGFATQYPSTLKKGSISASIALRWRSAGLHALQSITSSEAISADGGTQLNIIMPMILQNLHPGNEDYLVILQQRAKSNEMEDKELARRRMSIATVRTMEKDPNSDPGVVAGAVAGSADDADRLAEEEVALQALKCLKQIFVTSNRMQIRLATASVLRFVCKEARHSRDAGRKSRFGNARTWATTLIEMASRWTPVQDRFIILVTTMETLIRSPVVEENLEQQLSLVAIVGWLLKSNLNMIGLSVMDVLLGLVQHILLLLQLGGKGSNVLPHHQQTDAIDLFQDTSNLMVQTPLTNGMEKAAAETEASSPSANRQDLLAKLQRCIGDLATHVYYSDQISDIIGAILLRLKPSPLSGVSTVAAAIENPEAAVHAISTSVKLQENPDTHEFFSFGMARVTALKAIKEVLVVANAKGSVGTGPIGRNRVSLQVWEGTQWLLRDGDRRVRRAYVDALLTWLRLEMSQSDLRAMDDKCKTSKLASRADGESSGWGHLNRRAVSNASHKERSSKPTRSSFLQLLHLAIYNNAIESPESESDLLLLHLLMVNLTDKLGVNAAKSGIPMILRLQEDINLDHIIGTPTAKLNIGSLVHGYLWALSEKFDFDSFRVGFEIHKEITRRKNHGLWLEAIRIPAVPLDQIISVSMLPLSEKLPLPVLQKESLKPFDCRLNMVEQIATAYTFSLASPPNSPPTSPSRITSTPVLSNSKSPTSSDELPSTIKEAMLAEWSKEICIATVDQNSSRSASLNGSKTGTNLSGRHRKYLNVNGYSPGNGSPTGAHSPNRMPIGNQHNNHESAARNGLRSSLHDPLHIHHSSAHGSTTPLSSSDQTQVLRVDDLKRVLESGAYTRGASPLRNTTTQRDFTTSSGRHSISTGSESIVSFESASEGYTSSRSVHPAPINPSNPEKRIVFHSNPNNFTSIRPRSQSSRPNSIRHDSSDQNRPVTRSTMRPSSSSSSATEDPTANAKALRGDLVASLPSALGDSPDDDVPPVPPLPAGVVLQRNAAVGFSQVEPRPQSMSAGGVGDRGSVAVGGLARKKKGVDVSALLGSIDAMSGVGNGPGIGFGGGRPPY